MENSQENCIFCKIVQGELPAEKVYEDQKTLAFLDIGPVNPGHTLIIPKEHYVNVFEAPEHAWTEIMSSVKKVAHAIKDGLGVENMNITMNNGKHSGQVVFHAHVHVIPRHEGDGHRTWSKTEYKSEEAKKEIADKIKNAL